MWIKRKLFWADKHVCGIRVMLWTWVYLIGSFTLNVAATAPSLFNVSVPLEPVTAALGSSVTLPCEVSPSFSVVPFKVQWYRPNKQQTTVLIYEEQKELKTSVDPQYRARASLIGDLEKGDVSLKLENLILADRGQYVCLVNNFIWIDKASLILNLQVLGSIPVLSYTGTVDGHVNVSCMSDGWSPKPTLSWRDTQGELMRGVPETAYSTDADGLVSVRSWLLVSPSESEWISCSVYLSDMELRESRVLPHINTLQRDAVTPKSSGIWKGAFITLLVLLLLSICAVFFLYYQGVIEVSTRDNTEVKEQEITDEDKGCSQPTGNSGINTLKEENIPKEGHSVQKPPSTAESGANTFTPVVVEMSTMSDALVMTLPGLETVKENRVRLTLDPKTAPPFMKVLNHGNTVRFSDLENPVGLGDHHPHVLCRERFSSRLHYWEVGGNPEDKNSGLTHPKRESWYVGVCATTAAGSDVKTPVTPENGFWILHYHKGTGLFTNTDPRTVVPVTKMTDILGIYLDLDKHTLSFYNVTDKTHICTFYNITPLKILIPLFCPGLKKGESMQIQKLWKDF